jgi:hypothetical protein
LHMKINEYDLFRMVAYWMQNGPVWAK